MDIAERDSEDNFLVFPNPSSGVFYLENRNLLRNASCLISIYDVFGRKVYSQILSIEQQQVFDLTYLPTGIYLMERTTIRESERFKIVIK